MTRPGRAGILAAVLAAAAFVTTGCAWLTLT